MRNLLRLSASFSLTSVSFAAAMTLGLLGCGTIVDVGGPSGGASNLSTPDSGGGDATGDSGRTCGSSADCSGGETCGFAYGAGCTARGTCVPASATATECAEVVPYCACDGSQVEACPGPGSYSSKPISYVGECLSCPGAAMTGSIGSSCTKSSECNASELCAWPMSQSCSDSTPGTCVPMAEGCHCVPPPACGCDGQAAITGCSASLPFGYSLSPFAHVGACDQASSGTLVLFGGVSEGPDGTKLELSSDTYAFDGSNWTKLTISGRTPSARASAAMATLGGNSVVLFGGSDDAGGVLGDTWMFDGSSWTTLVFTKDPILPSARSGSSMAALGKNVVLFGGAGGGDPATFYDDTWIFDGSVWTQIKVSGPSGRVQAGMASLGDTIVLFGGGGAGATLGDTWTFDGKKWTEISPPKSPSPRASPSVAATGGKVVLFGGAPQMGPYDDDDTWIFDGTTWTGATGAHPSARIVTAVAAFPVGDDVVLFGGDTWDNDALNDTWTWNGSTWSEIHLGNSPSKLAASSMAFLP
jgi:hypothetical protein